jgi:hypothetical protein
MKNVTETNGSDVKRIPMKVFFSLVPVIAATSALYLGPVAPANAINCGDVVELGGNTVLLDSDLSCTDYDPALTVFGPGTLDMGGHTLTCSNSELGLLVEGYQANVLNGEVVGESCTNCLWVGGDGLHTVKGLTTIGCANDGVFVISNDNTLENSFALSNGNVGFFVADDTNGNTLDRTAASSNLFGYALRGESNIIINSHANDNLVDGIQITGGIRNEVRKSTVMGNGDDGVYANTGGGHLIQQNRVINNGGYGIQLIYTANNTILMNTSIKNDGTDLSDGYTDCDNNNWEGNNFGTADQDCID